MLKLTILSLLTIFLLTLTLQAQENPQPAAATEPETKNYLLTRGTKEFTAELGFSPFAPTHFKGPEEFNTDNRKLGLANFRIGRVIGNKKGVTYQYLFGFTPFAIFINNEVTNKQFVSATATPNIAPTKRVTTYGFGVQPLNFRFIFRPNRRVKPYAELGAGVLITNKAVPIPESRGFNFTGNFGGGFQVYTSPKRALSFGYRYFHISNGNLTEKVYNVGYNAQFFYVGYSIFK